MCHHSQILSSQMSQFSLFSWFRANPVLILVGLGRSFLLDFSIFFAGFGLADVIILLK